MKARVPQNNKLQKARIFGKKKKTIKKKKILNQLHKKAQDRMIRHPAPKQQQLFSQFHKF